MNIKLNKPFAANSAVDEFDVKQVKKALNRLGYYQPFEKVGVTGIPDTGVFEGLKSFQKDHGLQATGSARPGDETISKLNKEAGKKQSGKYVWRTVGDSKVRKSHSALNGTIRDLSDSPDPGEEINCRCWAEPINCDNEFITQNVISEINDAEDRWDWTDYLKHFYRGNGMDVDLSSIGWLGPIIEEAKNQVFVPVQEQVIALAREIEQGPLYYTTEKSYKFGGVSYPIGDATVSSETSGAVSINGKCLIIEAEVIYTFFDDFTDPLDIREINDAIQNNLIPEGAPDWLKIQLQRGGWTDLGGTPYLINGTWETTLSAVVKRKNQGGE